MITVEEAKKIIHEQAVALSPVQTALLPAAGMILAADVYATIDIPAFDQSSMDGYAICFDGWKMHKTLSIVGEIPAGANETRVFLPREAVRIFTGAAVPAGTDTVVMQEKVTVLNGTLTIPDENLFVRQHVRSAGSEIKAGSLALEAGTILSPAATGFLAGIGVTHVNVYPKPVVSIIVTGRELQQPGIPLQRGQVYESNSATLSAALQQLYIFNVKVSLADDNIDILQQVLEAAMGESDVVLLTGGVSVGDYDFVLEAAAKCGVEKLFHRVKQRPGKPLYLGKKGSKLVFGLPGNPSSVLTCFYEYVTPALQKISRYQPGFLKTLQVPIATTVEKNTGLTQFLKGFYDGEKVIVLDAQESYRLSSFARANCLVKIEEDITCRRAGENVEIHMLPG